MILLAGLQAIPRDLQEAAQLDGAGLVAQLRSVTLPLLSPSLFFVTVISLINGFQVFDQVWVMTGAARAARPASWWSRSSSTPSRTGGSATPRR